MAEKSAGRETVMKMISRVVPKAISEVKMTDKVQWSESSTDYDQVREELFQLLK
jgi:ABC-type phosphate/phosphonate transport system ATPase subunit